jgi:hypothetical protein
MAVNKAGDIVLGLKFEIRKWNIANEIARQQLRRHEGRKTSEAKPHWTMVKKASRPPKGLVLGDSDYEVGGLAFDERNGHIFMSNWSEPIGILASEAPEDAPPDTVDPAGIHQVLAP